MQALFGLNVSWPSFGWGLQQQRNPAQLTANQLGLCLLVIGTVACVGGAALPIPFVAQLAFISGMVMIVTGLGLLLVDGFSQPPVHHYGWGWNSWWNPCYSTSRPYHYYHWNNWTPTSNYSWRSQPDYSWHRGSRTGAPMSGGAGWGHRSPMPSSRSGDGWIQGSRTVIR